MIGPITFTIVDASLDGGIPSGIAAASGMWCSDFLYIIVCYCGAQQLSISLQDPEATHWVGLVGGCILIAIGLVIWMTRKRHGIAKRRSIVHYSGHWLRGFVVNTFAPFTLFFWPTMTLTIVLPNATSVTHAASFYLGVMASIMAGDMLKATFAGWVRQKISQTVLKVLRSGLAVLFVGAGLFLLGRAIWE